MKIIKGIAVFFLVLVMVLGVNFGLKYLGIIQYGFFAPKVKNIEREVFENTQSYVEGKRQELVKYRLEYMTTKDEDVKQAIKITIIQSFANFDKTKLDYELRTFLESLNN